ncbi:MAG: cation transporter [Flavobacteriaceae bacterium]
MIQRFMVQGMTCNGCLNKVKKAVESIEGVSAVVIDLASGRLSFASNTPMSLSQIKEVVPDDYPVLAHDAQTMPPNKWRQLRPLFLIFAFLFGTVFLIHASQWNSAEAMLDAMAGFFLIFSFFKLLDVPGFVQAFRNYDPLAKRLAFYAWIYPFIELLLAVVLLLRFNVAIALIITTIVLGITTIGVIAKLRTKQTIECACLGTTLNLPMTEATLIENLIMLGMASFTLYS